MFFIGDLLLFLLVMAEEMQYFKLLLNMGQNLPFQDLPPL
jgi:hypothetical protein